MKKNDCVALLASLLALTLTSRGVFASDDWTGWLGPDRNGWAADFQPPSTWPSELTEIWSVEVGTSYGTPIVVGNDIFQHARQGEDEVVWKLDRATGEVHWRKSFAVPFKVAGGGEYHGKGPKSCPAYADGRLFTLSIDGTLAAWKASTGEQIWQRNYEEKFGKCYPNWGASTSPIVDDNRVIVHFGTDDAGVLVALDTASGKEVWKHGEDGASYSSPLLAELGGVKQLIEWNHRAVVGVECRTGKFLWEFPLPHVGSNQNMPTPAIHDGSILIGGENRGIRSIRPQRKDGKWTVTEAWHQTRVALDMSSAVMNQDQLYGFSHYDSGRLFCLDTHNGNILWKGPPRTGENVTFLSAIGLIVALTNKGELKVLNASPENYEQIASYRVAEDHTWAPPVLIEGGLLIKDRQHLTRWSFDSPESSR